MTTDNWELSVWAAELPRHAGSPHASALRDLTKSVCDAESEYDINVRKVDDELKDDRMKRLEELNQLRHAASMCTCDSDLRIRLLCAAHEQTVQTFQAVKKCELDFVAAKIRHLNAILDGAQNVGRARNRLRLGGVLVALLFLIGIAVVMIAFPQLRVQGPTVMGVPNASSSGAPSGVSL